MARNPIELLEKVDDLPPIPAVAAKVLSLVEDTRTSANDLAQVLAADQVLTAKLIKVSNSAYYGFSRKVSTVREAVVAIGFKQVRQIAVGASVIQGFKKSLLSTELFDLDLFWGHSMAVAVAAEALAKKSRVCKPEDAFTAGILHDIGRLIIRQGRPAEFERAIQMARGGSISLHAAEIRSTGFAHDEVGRALGELWKFPSHLIDAIDGHHNTNLTPREDGLAGVLAKANRLILHYGLFCGYDVDGGEPVPIPEDLVEVELAAGGIDLILGRAFAFIEAASGTPERWYHAAAA
jgi:putative nucleotidyltransferase with HDIG domain